MLDNPYHNFYVEPPPEIPRRTAPVAAKRLSFLVRI